MAIIEEHKALKVGSLLTSKYGDYKIVSILGMGGFGITYKATKTVYEKKISQEHTYAIKEFFRSEMCTRDEKGNVIVNTAQQENYNKLRKAFQKEASLLNKLPEHKGFVSVNELFDANNTSYYVMEYLDNSLTQKVKNSKENRLTEEEALDIICKIANAVAELHSNKRLHLDIKPDNIMFREDKPDEPCLIDFGNSRSYKKSLLGNDYELENKDTPIVFSDGYSPTEQRSGINTFSPAADIYSLGATLLYILTGKNPLPANKINDSSIEEALKDVKIKEETKNAIHRAMAFSPSGRYQSVEELLDSINYESTGDSDTTVIGEGKKTSKTTKTRETLAKIRSITVKTTIAIIVLCLIVVFTVFMLNKCTNTPTTDNIPADTTTNTTENNDSTIEENPISPEDKDPLDDKKDDSNVVQKEDNNENNTNNNIAKKEKDSKPTPSPTPTPKTKKENKKDLGWGIWEGTVVDGTPVGKGTIMVKQSKSFSEIKVKSGDIIEHATMDGDNVSTGTVRHTDGSTDEI